MASDKKIYEEFITHYFNENAISINIYKNNNLFVNRGNLNTDTL